MFLLRYHFEQQYRVPSSKTEFSGNNKIMDGSCLLRKCCIVPLLKRYTPKMLEIKHQKWGEGILALDLNKTCIDHALKGVLPANDLPSWIFSLYAVHAAPSSSLCHPQQQLFHPECSLLTIDTWEQIQTSHPSLFSLFHGPPTQKIILSNQAVNIFASLGHKYLSGHQVKSSMIKDCLAQSVIF